MIDILIKNAAEILTCRSRGPKIGKELDELDILKNENLAVENGKIIAIGNVSEESRLVIDAAGKTVLPGFVDCHTHLVFAGSREDEFLQKIKGVSYLEILKEGGGILSTVEKTRKAPILGLTSETLKRIKLASSYGTTTMEVKSGYGLDLLSELMILTIIKNLQGNEWVDLVPTFLGAHAIPPEFKNNKKGYIREVLKMIERVRKENLAEYCDVFVEQGAFNVREARRILKKAKECGLKLKLHAGEFNDIGGVELGVELGATSIDHLDYISEEGMRVMAEKKIIGVLLPGVPFHLMTGHYAPARKMIEVGVPIALATDFNPGSCPTLSMQMIIAISCRQLKMTPAEAINAATINAAYAIDRSNEIGSLEVGKKADIVILDVPSHKQLPYWFGMNLVKKVIKNGKIVK